MEFKKHPERMVRHFLSAPFIYAMALPLVFLDVCMEVYHHVCFPLYGIPLVVRSKYIHLDRHKLSYLSWIEKINCDYCAYANGLLFYVSVIAAETEKYWCAIKHEGKKDFIPPPHHSRFLAYGDEEGFKKLTTHNH